MKTLILASLLFCQVFPAFSQVPTTKGPFGLEAGMNKKQVAALVGGEIKLKPTQNNVYSVESVPNPYPLFGTYSLYIDPDMGLMKIIAWSKAITTNTDGSEIKDKFKELRTAVNDSYGNGETFDYLKVGSTLRGPEDWMAGLLKKERVLASYWLKKDISTLKNKISAINLEAVALSPTRGLLFLSYEFEEPRATPVEQKPQTNSPL
jgi:hypothetical protein